MSTNDTWLVQTHSNHLSLLLYYNSLQPLAGNEYLEELDFLKYNIWYNVGALFVYAFIMLFIAYLALLFTKKDK